MKSTSDFGVRDKHGAKFVAVYRDPAYAGLNKVQQVLGACRKKDIC